MMGKPRDRTILPGLGYSEKPEKNFLVENIKMLRHMQRETQKKLQSQNQIRSYSSNASKVKNSPSKNRSYHKGSKSDQELCNSAGSSIISRLSTPVTAMASAKPVKNQGMQTVAVEKVQKGKKVYPRCPNRNDPDDQATVTKPSKNCIVRSASLPPLSRTFESETTESNEALNDLMSNEMNKHALKELIGEPKDFVTYNTFRTYEKKHKPEKPDPVKLPSNYRKGEVPKYLRSSKKDISTPECSGDYANDKKDNSPGFVQFSDKDRKTHLEDLKKTYAELVFKLRNIPLSSDSYSNRQKKITLEKELEKLEKLMNLFSRNRLYAKEL